MIIHFLLAGKEFATFEHQNSVKILCLLHTMSKNRDSILRMRQTCSMQLPHILTQNKSNTCETGVQNLCRRIREDIRKYLYKTFPRRTMQSPHKHLLTWPAFGQLFN